MTTLHQKWSALGYSGLLFPATWLSRNKIITSIIMIVFLIQVEGPRYYVGGSTNSGS